MAEAFYRSFDLPVTIVRPFNTYGPRQSARAIIPTIITQLLSGSSEIKLGSLSPTRDLVYVKDTARGFAEIARCDTLLGEEVNLATQQEISMGDLAQHIINIINPSATVVEDAQRVRPTKSEVNRLLGANQKVLQHTAWTPRHRLEEGLTATIEWFRKYHQPDHKSAIYHV